MSKSIGANWASVRAILASSVWGRVTGVLGNLAASAWLSVPDLGVVGTLSSISGLCDWQSKLGVVDAAQTISSRSGFNACAFEIEVSRARRLSWLACCIIACYGLLVLSAWHFVGLCLGVAICAEVYSRTHITSYFLRSNLQYAEISKVDVMASGLGLAITITGLALGCRYYAILFGAIGAGILKAIALRSVAIKSGAQLATNSECERALYTQKTWWATMSVYGMGLLANADYLVIRQAGDDSDVGMYFVAFMLCNQPIALIVARFGNYVVSVVAAQRHVGAGGSGIRMALLACTVLCCAGGVCAYFGAMWLLPKYAGGRYMAASEFLAPLTIGAMIRGSCWFWDDISKGFGAMRQVGLLSIVMGLVHVAILVLASQGGVGWVAWGVAGSYTLTSFFGLMLLSSVSGIELHSLAAVSIIPALVLATCFFLLAGAL